MELHRNLEEQGIEAGTGDVCRKRRRKQEQETEQEAGGRSRTPAPKEIEAGVGD